VAAKTNTLHAATILALWATAEKEAAPLLGSHATAALWGTAWFAGYSIGLRLAGRARGRKRLTLYSTLAAAAGALAVWRAPGPAAAAAAGYWLLALAGALAVSAAVAAAVRERLDLEWRTSIAGVKAWAGVASAALLLGAHYLASQPQAVLLAAAVPLAAVAYARYWDPPISPIAMKVLDDFALAAALLSPRPRDHSPVLALAVLAGALASLKITMVHAASQALGPAATVVHAGALALGAGLAAAHSRPSPVLAGLLGGAGVLLHAIRAPAWAGLAAYSLALGYADAGLLIAALEYTPTGAPRYSAQALVWMLAGTLVVAAAEYIGYSAWAALAVLAAAAAAAWAARRGSRWS